MEPLPIVITEAGLAAIVDAAGGGTNAVTVAEIGLTNTAFVADKELIAIPGEIKRVATISGMAADARTVHLTMRDYSGDQYEFNGFGVFLSDGTLLGSYSQEEAIAGKAAVSLLYIAFDFRLNSPVAELFEFGDANFINPPATVTTPGVAQLASSEDVAAGIGSDTIVTPEALAAAYVALALLGAENGVATLDNNGKLLLDQRPPIDLIDVFPAANEAAMLALAATPGDFAVRADVDSVFVLQATPASTLGNWLELSTPSPVMSVNGKVGVVVLDPADIGAVPTARAVTGSGLATGGGALNIDRAINVPKASPEEVIAGVVDTKAVTPLGLAGLLAAIGAGVPSTRQITGGGLVTGGGSLAADRVLSVAIATAAEAFGGLNNTKALTPASLSLILEDLALKVPQTRSITTSGLAKGGGSLAATRDIAVDKASAAEALAGSIDTKALTPASLSSILAQIAAKAAAAITISATGLASGGGNLNANRAINVAIASAAEVLAMAINDKAVTPAGLAGLISVSHTGSTLVLKIAGTIFQLFTGTVSANGSTTLSLPESFPSQCTAAFVNGGRPITDTTQNAPYASGWGTNSVTVFNAMDVSGAVNILAIGK